MGSRKLVPGVREWSSEPWAALLVALVISATIGLPLLGVGSLHAADTLQTLDPWAQSADPGFHPDNGTVSDTVDAIAPVRLAVADRARTGDLALWSSTQGGGAPALGVPNTAMFSPLNLPWWIAPAHWAPALAKAVQMVVAALGLFLLARRMGASRLGGVVGALAFVNAGHLVVWTTWPQSNLAALAPLLLWSVDRAAEDPSPGTWWPVPLVSATMWLEGFPFFTLSAHALALTWALVRLTRPHFPDRVPDQGHDGTAGAHDRRRAGAAVVGAFVAGLSIAAVQVVPFLFRIDELGLGTARDAKAADALPWESLGTVLFPRVLGASGQSVWYGPGNEVEVQAFAGMTALVLVVAAWAWARRSSTAVPTRWWTWSGASAGVLAAMIWVGPVNDLVQAVPVIGSNQTGRLRGLVAVLLAVWVAQGFDAVRAEVNERRRLGPWLTAVLTLVVACLPALVRARSLAQGRGREAFWTDAVIAPLVLLALAVTAVVIATRTRGRARQAAVVLLPLLLAVEVTGFARGFLPRIDTDDFYPRTTAHDVVADLVGSDRFAAGGSALYPGTTTRYGLRSITAHAGMPTAWRELLLEVDASSLDRNATFPMLAPTLDVAASPTLDLLGVSHFVTELDVAVFGELGTPVVSGSTLSVGPPLNGVAVERRVLDLLADHDQPLRLAGQVISPAGDVVASGSRRIDPGEDGGWLTLALSSVEPGRAGPTSGRLEVFLRLDPEDPGLAVPLEAGTLVRPIRVGGDGLTVVATPDVIVYERPDALPRIRLETEPGVALTDGLLVLEDQDDEALVEVTTDRATTLVVADAHSGGHRASIDGDQVAAVAVHGALVGVTVPAGNHQVRIWWEPEGFHLGASLTVLGLFAVWAALAASAGGWPLRRAHRGG